ncbi:hypothetical protein HRbin30_01411 [bacterium HR30]|nr:hypothetical protein HRbin30_01411 [bacterium HR30]
MTAARDRTGFETAGPFGPPSVTAVLHQRGGSATKNLRLSFGVCIVKLIVRDIEEQPRRVVYEEPTALLNAQLVAGTVRDYELPTNAQVRLDYYRAGVEVFLQGHVEGNAVGYCARCLESYPFSFATDFSLVLLPQEELPPNMELTQDDLDLAYYEGEEIDLSPIVAEHILLALPTRPLCSEECRGLCPSCGVNRNFERCDCEANRVDPRWAALREIKLDR